MDPTLALLLGLVTLALILGIFVGGAGYSYHLGRKHGGAEMELLYEKAENEVLLSQQQDLRKARTNISMAESALGSLADSDLDVLLSFSEEAPSDPENTSSPRNSKANEG